MTEQQADLPDKYILGDSWGLGWIRFGWDGRRLIGHDGNTLGQAAFLRVLPDEGLAVTLLTNGGNTRDLYEDLYREIFAELAGVEMPHPLEPARRARARSTSRRTSARTSAPSVRLEVLERDGRPILRTDGHRAAGRARCRSRSTSTRWRPSRTACSSSASPRRRPGRR